jgi:cobalt-zinc-cadmium efflux system outer membrane protein
VSAVGMVTGRALARRSRVDGASFALAAALGAMTPRLARAQAPDAPRSREAPPTAPSGAPSNTSRSAAEVPPVRPESDGGLSLPGVIDSLQRVLPSLLAAEREREAAEAEFLAAEGGFDPTLRARGTTVPLGYYRYVTGDVVVEQPTALWGASLFAGYRLGVPLVPGSPGLPDYSGGSQTNYFGEVRAGLSVPLLRNGAIDRRRANVQVRGQGRSIAEADLERARIEASRFAATRFWDWVAAGRKLAIARDLLRVASDRQAGLETRARVGDLAQYEAQDNERAVLSRQASVVSAQQTLARAAIELSLFYRDEQGVPVLPRDAQLPAALADVDPRWTASAGGPEAERQALAARPEVRRFDAQLAQSRVELEFARNQMLPALDLQAQVSQDLGAAVSSSDTRGRPELSAGVLLEVPIVMRAQRGRLRAAEAAVARIEAQRTFARDRVVADVRDATAGLRAALERVELTGRELALARRVEDAERERFRQGDSSIFLVNQREQATAEAAGRLVDASADWLRAQAAYRAALGQR